MTELPSSTIILYLLPDVDHVIRISTVTQSSPAQKFDVIKLLIQQWTMLELCAWVNSRVSECNFIYSMLYTIFCVCLFTCLFTTSQIEVLQE